MQRDNRITRHQQTERAVPAHRGATTPVADESQNWWYKISGSGWLPQSDVEEVNQYDLLKLGFQALEEELRW
jgi:hypothetical protein